jgi:metal-dependent amidase/aminoacylase/carboxypeptidase family protein
MKRRLLIVLCGVFVLLQVGCQHTASQSQPSLSSATDAIRLQTDSLYDKLVGIRRNLHEHPELAGNETRTSATIALHLREMGLEVQTGLYGHSVVGILRGGHQGRTVAWRAEIDALAGDFTDPALFKSKTPGVHHACGHDVHIAIALGIAEVLAKNRQSLHGTAVLLFQPEEETFKGAKALVERGVFASVTPDEIYGVHVTVLPVGQIVVRENEMFSYQRRISIRLKNELSKSEIQQLGKRVHSALFRTRPDAKPWEIQNVADPVIGLTSQTTEFQDYLIINEKFDTRTDNGELVLEADLYETSAANLASIIPRIEGAIDASGHKRQLLSVRYVQENPTVLNNPALTRLAIRTLQRTQGVGAVTQAYGQAPFFNDDFAYFQQKIPGVYFFLGGSNAEKGLIAMNHAPNFQVDEESIKVGVRSFSSLIIARLGKHDEAQRD